MLFCSEEVPSGLLILKAGKVIKELFRLSVEKNDILHGHAMIMNILHQYPELSQSQLAKILAIKPSSVSALLQNMEKDGLIVRSQDKNDVRVQLTSLTLKGKEKVKIVEQIWQEIDQKMKIILSEEELNTLREYSKTIIKSQTKFCEY